MSALGMSPRAHVLNDEANDLFGEILHGRATVEQIARFERAVAELQDELCAGTDYLYPTVTIDAANLEAWEESRARDFDVTDEIPF